MKTPVIAGAHPGFLERRIICIKLWGFVLLILSHFFLKCQMKIIHMIFKIGGGGGGGGRVLLKRNPYTPLDPPLHCRKITWVGL